MIDTPTENVALTFEQMQQIDVVQKKLSNIQNEIVLASKLLNQTKLECQNVTKEKVYQEELLDTLKIKVSEIKNIHEDLNGKVELSKNTLEENNRKSKEIIQLYESKSIELKDKEEFLNIKIENHTKNVEEFKKESKNLLEEKKLVDNAKSIFSKALESITW